MARAVMLTTIDNPYSPFTQYADWLAYDEAAHHYTNGALARVVVTSEELSEADQLLATEEAIDLIVRENPLGLYRKEVLES